MPMSHRSMWQPDPWPDGSRHRLVSTVARPSAEGLEEGSAREGFVAHRGRPRRPRRLGPRRAAALCIAGAAALLASVCARRCAQAFALAVLGTEGCGTAGEALVVMGAPRALAAAAPALVCVNGTALWAPRELSREGLQRSEELSPWCGKRVAVRASAVTIDAQSFWGPLGRQRVFLFRGPLASCAQRALESLKRGAAVCE